MADTQREAKEPLNILLTGPGQFLLWLYKRQIERGETETSLGEARKALGSKVYNHAYKLALHGLLVIINDKYIKISEKGKEIASCLHKCTEKPLPNPDPGRV